MKLSRIYSNTSQMRPIEFNGGFNVIFGNVFASNEREEHEHNLGKTALVYLIDFLLLKQSKKKDIFSRFKKKFTGWVFFLEIELNSGSYMTIRRCVDFSARASFKLHSERGMDFTKEASWDYDEVSISAKKGPNAVEILDKLLGFNIAREYHFRKFLPYILRSQSDYGDVFVSEKFKGPDSDWKPFLYDIFGFDSKLLEVKYSLDAEIELGRAALRRLEAENILDSDKELYTFRAAIEAKEKQKKELSLTIDRFNFYIQEQDLNYELVNKIEESISSLNAEEYKLGYDIDRITKSLQNNGAFSLEEITEIYKEAKVYFPEILNKSYSEVVRFNEQISNERSKYLKGELSSANIRLQQIKEELKNLNLRRSDILSLLKERDVFVKFKEYQKEIIKIESELAHYRERIANIDSIDKFNDKLSEYKEKVNALSVKIKDNIDENNEIYQKVKDIFGEIVNQVLGQLAVIVVAPNKRSGNVDFSPITLSSDNSDATGETDGYTATKVQCSAFALAVLAVYSKESYFRFAYHDGLFESWGDNPKMNFIMLIKEICAQYNLQYIVSMIKSDVPAGYQFDESEKIAILDENNKLFGIDF